MLNQYWQADWLSWALIWAFPWLATSGSFNVMIPCHCGNFLTSILRKFPSLCKPCHKWPLYSLLAIAKVLSFAEVLQEAKLQWTFRSDGKMTRTSDDHRRQCWPTFGVENRKLLIANCSEGIFNVQYLLIKLEEQILYIINFTWC